MKNQSSGEAFRGLLARWPLFSSVGLTAGIALALVAADPLEKLVGMMLVTPIMFIAAGTVFGGSQWLAIWRFQRKGLAWIFATGLAVGIGMTLGLAIVEIAGRAITGEPLRLFSATATERTIALAVIGLFTGLAIGVSQWLVMRQHLDGLSWIFLTALAFTIGFPSGAFVAGLLPGGLQDILGFVLFLSITGLIVGAITALPAQQMKRRLAESQT